MEDIDCIFCRGRSEHVVVRENGFVGRKCMACELIYISPRPSAEEMLLYYSSGAGAQKYVGQHVPIRQAKRIQAKHTLGLLRRFASGGSLLELRSGSRLFSRRSAPPELRRIRDRTRHVRCRAHSTKSNSLRDRAIAPRFVRWPDI